MEVVAPAQHDALHAAFGPKPFGGIGGDGRFSSSLSSLGGDRFFGYSTTTASSCFGNSPGLSSPSPRAASLSRGSSESGSVVDDGDDAADAATVAERRLRLARLALQYQEVVNRFELCLSYLADASNEAAALRRENDELRVANEDLARRIEVVGCKLVDEFSSLRLAEEHATPPPPPPPPPSPLPVAPVMPKSISIRSPGYLKMNQNGKHRASKPTKVSVRSTPNPFPPLL
jgi:butyrate response factor 1